MSMTLLQLRTEARETVGDLGVVDFEDLNMTDAVNFAVALAAKLTGFTREVHAGSVGAGGNTLDATGSLAVTGLVML